MTARISYPLAIAVVGAAISFMLDPAQAAILTYDFTVDVTSGELSGNQYGGYFSYDDAARAAVSQPYFDVTDFHFDFDRLYTRSDLILDGRQGAAALPLEIRGGETTLDPATGSLAVTPHGGDLVRFAFSNFDSHQTTDFFSMLGSPNQSSFVYGSYPNNLPIIGSGTVSYAQRSPAAVPEPDGAIALTSLFGLGLLLKLRPKRRQQSPADEKEVAGTR